MSVYSNAFRIATSADEVIIEFLMSRPDFNENNDVVGQSHEVVSSVVLSRKTAHKLWELLDQREPETGSAVTL